MRRRGGDDQLLIDTLNIECPKTRDTCHLLTLEQCSDIEKKF